MSGVIVRAAGPGDLAAVEALLRESQLPTAGVDAPLDGFMVAEHDGMVVGVTGLEPCGRHYGLLRSAAVAPAWRGRGVGSTLVERVIEEARARRLRALFLLTTTAADYFPAFGFEVVARAAVPSEVQATAEFTTACPASATAMTRVFPDG